MMAASRSRPENYGQCMFYVSCWLEEAFSLDVAAGAVAIKLLARGVQLVHG
jgi:hypothetical protein